jgi:hypothetical protein
MFLSASMDFLLGSCLRRSPQGVPDAGTPFPKKKILRRHFNYARHAPSLKKIAAFKVRLG